MENCNVVPLKIKKNYHMIQQFFLWLYKCTKELKTVSDICIPIFIAALLFIIDKGQEQLKCLLMGEWINKIYVYTIEYHSALKRKKILMHATA